MTTILRADDIHIGTRYTGSNGHSTVTAIRGLPAGRLELTLWNEDSESEWTTVWSTDENPVFLAGFHNEPVAPMIHRQAVVVELRTDGDIDELVQLFAQYVTSGEHPFLSDYTASASGEAGWIGPFVRGVTVSLNGLELASFDEE